MKRIVLFATLAAVLLGTGAVRLHAADADEQRAVVDNFLRAYFRNNWVAVKRLVPGNRVAMFGPYLYKEFHLADTEKVQTNQAVVEFTAVTTDGNIPAKGGLLMYKKDGTWLVRQVLYYDKVPRIFRLPNKSVTAADRAEEPRARAVAVAFMSAWKSGDDKTMLRHSYDWLSRDDDEIAGLRITNLTTSVTNTNWGDPFVKYSVKATYHFGPLSYSMTLRGGLILVKENGLWKVRANQMIMAF
jgi:hypothetical protein